MDFDANILASIYEAALLPQAWESAIDQIAHLVGAISGTVVAFETPGQAPQCWQTARVRDAVSQWMNEGLWHVDSMALKMAASSAHFINKQDFVNRDQWMSDPTSDVFRRDGIDHQVFLPVRVPQGNVTLFSFERGKTEGRFPADAFERLDAFIPHLSRAAQIFAQMRTSHLEAAARALEAFGVPAAVLNHSGRVGAVNALFERDRDAFVDTAFGRLALADPVANNVFQEALTEVAQAGVMARTVPVPANGARAALVLHLVSLQRSARDVFPGAAILLTVTEIGTTRHAPDAQVLCGLFGLSPSEARLSVDLALGLSVSEAARKSGVTPKTMRTYLERIFHKTGTHRQSELVALLKAVTFRARSAPYHSS